MRPVIIVRPELGARATAERAQALGLRTYTVQLFVIEPLGWDSPDPALFDALLLTSANAVRLAGAGLAALAGLPCHAVGAATAAAARAAGLNIVDVGNADAQALLDAMTSQGHTAILWLAGADRTALSPGKAEITAIACYRAAPLPAPPGWADAIASPAVILLHSARTARRAAALAGDKAKHLIALAISEQVAAAAGDGWEQCHAAPRPCDADMLAMAAKLCQTPPP
jgi:uroporphyrinogen-III synthase